MEQLQEFSGYEAAITEREKDLNEKEKQSKR
jgi:hypothetical protein